MSEQVKAFFMLVGLFSSAAIMALMMSALSSFVIGKIKDKIYSHKLLHQFDKPPTAECYCVDCIRYGGRYPNSCKREGVDRMMPPNGFCHEAYPKSRELSKFEKNLKKFI